MNTRMIRNVSSLSRHSQRLLFNGHIEFIKSAGSYGRDLSGVVVPDATESKIEGSMAKLLDGRRGATQWLNELQPEVHRISQRLHRRPKLSVVLVGDRADSQLYVHRKAEVCNEVGIDVETQWLPASTTQSALEQRVRNTCTDPVVDGVLIQLPLPAHLDEEAVSTSLDPWKDVDGVHPLNVGHLLMRGHCPRFIPCTALGSMHLLKLHRIEVANKTAVVVGDSNCVGIPLSVLLRNQNAAIVSICHGISYKELFDEPDVVQWQRVRADTCNPALPGPIDRWSIESMDRHAKRCPIERNDHLPSITRTADILVVAVGWPKLVTADWVKPGAVVVDVGINVLRDKSKTKPVIAGDVDFAAVRQKASAITPVPGGVGPMTIAAVVHNTLQAAKHRSREMETTKNNTS